MDMSGNAYGVGATRVTVALVVGFAVSVGIALGSAQTTAAKTVWDGAFSAAQAGRGKTIYVAECSGCHLETLQGDGGASPALIGKDFVEAWDKKSVRDLFSRIRTRCPRQPRRPYRSALRRHRGYLLQMNKFPAGDRSPPPDAEALRRLIQRKQR
jgi:hypothetical protein